MHERQSKAGSTHNRSIIFLSRISVSPVHIIGIDRISVIPFEMELENVHDLFEKRRRRQKKTRHFHTHSF